jgi:TM2 domain-containing membrane protein YozV
MMQYNNSKKDPTVAVLLSLFLGAFGAHKFYMGKTGMGILYLIFSWTTIPAFLGLVEAFTLSEKVAKHNEETALELSVMF